MNHVNKSAPTPLSLFAFVAFTSCAKAPEMEPRFLPVSDAAPAPPGKCVAVASVNSPWTFWKLTRQKAEEIALETLKETAAAKGGNYVRYEALNWHEVERNAAQASAHGTAYKCEAAPPVTVAVAAPPVARPPSASPELATPPPGGAPSALTLRCVGDGGLTTCGSTGVAKP
jgi:hypothetical protein